MRTALSKINAIAARGGEPPRARHRENTQTGGFRLVARPRLEIGAPHRTYSERACRGLQDLARTFLSSLHRLAAKRHRSIGRFGGGVVPSNFPQPSGPSKDVFLVPFDASLIGPSVVRVAYSYYEPYSIATGKNAKKCHFSLF
jgi:hypothetical protein